MNSAAISRPAPSVVLELLKPITWFPPMWALGCGIVSSGVSPTQRWPLIVAGVVLIRFSSGRAPAGLPTLPDELQATRPPEAAGS